MVCNDPPLNPAPSHTSVTAPAAGAPAGAGGPAVGTTGSNQPSPPLPVPGRSINLPLPGFEGYFPPLPIELDNSTGTLTASVLDPIFEQWEKDRASRHGVCLNVFPSGEITGGYFRTGPRKTPSNTERRTVSQEFTRHARKTIRRAVECSDTEFRLFITLTFDPKQAQLDESGRVDQKWAKKEFTRFLNTVKKTYDRKAEKRGKDRQELSYIWVAEIQEKSTHNIHFHILADEPFIPASWLVKVWDQAPNSVNVKRLSNQDHAVNYMLKYMKKGNCPIEGKRYGMSHNLLKKLKPVKMRFVGKDKRDIFNEVKRTFSEEITRNGGRDMMFGLFIPPSKRAQSWRDISGKVHYKPGVSRYFGQKIVRQMKLKMAQAEFLQEQPLDDEITSSDLPF
jgi:hypothetical protein